MPRAEDMSAALVSGGVTLLDLIPSSGAAAWVNGRLATVGKVLPTPVIEQLIKWLDSTSHTIFHTHQLGAVFEPALRYNDTASGLLAIASERRERDYILWFRPELIETVTWGGRPDKPVEVGSPGDRLMPRKSFEAWQQEMRERSAPWDQDDLEIAQSFRVTLLETILRQVDSVQRERGAVIEHLNMLMAELDHRVKNILATILAVVQLTKSNAEDLESYAMSLRNRIRAMASAHELLAETRWHGLSLAALLAEEVAPFAAGDRVIISGKSVILSPRAALPLALVVHELVTNSVKYGALSVPDGQIEIVWDRDDENNVVLHWRESGGPPVSPPVRRGFGSLLIGRSLKQEIGGSVTQNFEPEGLICHLVIPLSHVSWTG
jgi:two-component system, chemotaxis family, sensor kinase Cph1